MTITIEQARERLQMLLDSGGSFSMDVGFEDYPINIIIEPICGGFWVVYYTLDCSVEHVFPSDVKIELREHKHRTWKGEEYTSWHFQIGEKSKSEYKPSLEVWIDEGKDIFRWSPKEVQE